MDIARRAALISFIASLAILALKFVAYFKTGSTAVLSDALESIINVIASGVALFVMKAVESPADDEHPYGHGKLEFFSAAFEGGLITFAGIIIGIEAIRSFSRGAEPRNLDIGLWISILAAAANLALGFFLLQVGRKKHSEALISSGQHVISDVWSTAGVLVGLGLVLWTGKAWFDPAAALVIAVQLAVSGYKIVRRSAGGLIDEVEEEALKDLAFAFEKNRRPGVIDIHLTKIIRSGRFHHVDCHMAVPEFWSISQAHILTDAFEKAVFGTYPLSGEVNFHLDPCERAYCSHCDLPDCPVRQRPFVKLLPMTAQSLRHQARKDSPHVG